MHVLKLDNGVYELHSWTLPPEEGWRDHWQCVWQCFRYGECQPAGAAGWTGTGPTPRSLIPARLRRPPSDALPALDQSPVPVACRYCEPPLAGRSTRVHPGCSLICTGTRTRPLAGAGRADDALGADHVRPPLPWRVGHRTFAVGNGSDSWPSVIPGGVPPRVAIAVIHPR